MKKELIEAATNYVQGKMTRENVIQEANKYFKLESYHEESLFYNLLEMLFEDPDDNELLITRDSIIRVLDNYLNESISIEEVELWFWDVLSLNIEGDDPEQELISYLVDWLDNIAINEITTNDMIEVNLILKNVSNAEHALKKIKFFIE